MTRNRAVKKTTRRQAEADDVPYTKARQQRQAALFDVEEEWDEDLFYGCCAVVDELADELRERFTQGGVDGLTESLTRLQSRQMQRSSHYDYWSSHAVLLTAEAVCSPLLYRTGIRPGPGRDLVWREALLSGAEHDRLMSAYRELEQATSEAKEANAPY